MTQITHIFLEDESRILKALLVVRYLNFRLDLFGHVKKRLQLRTTSSVGKLINIITCCPMSQEVKTIRQ